MQSRCLGRRTSGAFHRHLPESHFPTINHMILPAELRAYRMKLFSAGHEILQGGEVLVHIFQPLGDAHGYTFVKLGRH